MTALVPRAALRSARGYYQAPCGLAERGHEDVAQGTRCDLRARQRVGPPGLNTLTRPNTTGWRPWLLKAAASRLRTRDLLQSIE